MRGGGKMVVEERRFAARIGTGSPPPAVRSSWDEGEEGNLEPCAAQLRGSGGEDARGVRGQSMDVFKKNNHE